MRPSIATLAGLFFSATLLGCGASATIPEPPAKTEFAPPPGTSPEMTEVKKGGGPGGMTGGMLGPAKAAPKPANR
jgi:hypothetical protein